MTLGREHAIAGSRGAPTLTAAVRTFASNLKSPTARYVAAEGINRGGRFVLLVLLARHLGAEGFGPWILAAAAGTIVANVGDFGLATELTRSLASDPARRRAVLQNIWIAAASTTALSGAIVVAIAATLLEGDARTLLLCAGIGGALESASLLLLAPLRAMQRLTAESVVRALQGSVLLVAGGAILLASGPPMAVALLFPAVGAVSVGIAAVALVLHFGVVLPRADLTLMRSLAARAFPVLATTLLFFVYFRIDAFLLAGMRGDEAVGVYGAAFNFTYGLAFLPLTFGRAMMPRFAAAADASSLGRAYRRSMAVVVGLGAAISIALLALTPAFERLYGSGFEGMRTPYLLLIVAQFLYLATNMHVELLFGRSKGRAAVVLTAGALALNVALNLAFIPAFGPAGAATTMIVSESALLVLLLVVARQIIPAAASQENESGAPLEAPELATAA